MNFIVKKLLSQAACVIHRVCSNFQGQSNHFVHISKETVPRQDQINTNGTVFTGELGSAL